MTGDQSRAKLQQQGQSTFNLLSVPRLTIVFIVELDAPDTLTYTSQSYHKVKPGKYMTKYIENVYARQ